MKLNLFPQENEPWLKRKEKKKMKKVGKEKKLKIGGRKRMQKQREEKKLKIYKRVKDEQCEKSNNIKMIAMNSTVKIIPLEFPGAEKEDVDIEEKKQKIQKDEEKTSTSWTRAKMLDMTAWYLVPGIYITFTITYFAIYMF